MQIRPTATALRMALLGIVAAAALLASTPAVDAGGKTKTARQFELEYAWGTTDPGVFDLYSFPTALLTLKPNGRVDVVDHGTTYLNVGAWGTQRNGRFLTIELDNGTIYEGVRQTDGSYVGSMTSYVGTVGVWVGEFLP